MGRRTIKRGAGEKRINGKDFLLAGEIEYIRIRAAEHDAFVFVDRETARITTILGYLTRRLAQLG